MPRSEVPEDFLKPPAARNGQASPQWPVLGEEALQGLPGEIVRAIEPHSEADNVALLVNLLAAFGSAAGRGTYLQVGADRHGLNLFAALVGETAKGRKGSSWSFVRDLMSSADMLWPDRVQTGLSSGEGLIHAVRDGEVDYDAEGSATVIDAGVSDKRLLVLEGEFGGSLGAMTRQGSTLSAVLRQAWDGGKLATLTRNSPLAATDPHISVIGHVTKAELLKKLGGSDTENGFSNRFLWVLVRRSKSLPFGGEWHAVDVAPLVRSLSQGLRFAESAGALVWGPTARERWREVYTGLSEGSPGLLGAATARAEAQVVRLAALYAVLDGSRTLELPHLEAALTLWRYSEASAEYIFGTATGDSIADKITARLEDAPEGLTRSEVRELFKRNVSSERIGHALSTLEGAGRIQREQEASPGRGRPTERIYSA